MNDYFKRIIYSFTEKKRVVVTPKRINIHRTEFSLIFSIENHAELFLCF